MKTLPGPGSATAADREVELSRQRLRDTNEQVVKPLRAAAAQNNFAEMIAQSLAQGHRKRDGEMSQAGWLVLALKVGLVSGFVSLIAWIVLYSVLADWWSNPIGRTLVTKTALIAALFVPSILGLFFHLGRQDSYIVGWIDVGLIGLVTPVMLWRSLVWIKLHRAGKLPKNGNDGGGT